MANVIRSELEFGGLFTSLDETRIPSNRAWSLSNCNIERGILEAREGYALFGQRTGAHANDVGWGFAYGKYSGDETQIIKRNSGTITGGTFTITWNGQTTAAIDWDATASEIQSALEDLSNLLVGDVLVTGKGWTEDDTFKVTFKGQYANTNVVTLSVTSSLTGSGVIALGVEVEINGGLSEEYLAVVQPNGSTTANLYSVDPSTGTFTQVLTDLDASDWFFAQFGNKIFGVNARQGMISKIIGTTAGLSSSRPTAPALLPDATIQGNTAQLISISGLSTGNYVGWGTNPTPTITGSGTAILALNAGVSAGTVLGLDFIYTGDQDFSLNDVWAVNITSTKPTNLDGQQHLNTTIRLEDNAANVIEPAVYGTGVLGSLGRYAHFQGEERTKRTIIRKIRISFRVDVNLSSGSDSISVQPVRGRQWPNNSVPIDMDVAPEAKSIDYAYSYRDLTGGLESDLSPVVTSGILPSTSVKWGANVLLEGDVSGALLATDLLYFYRREKATGKMRRLPNIDGTYGVLNTGTPQFTDTYLESELAGFPEFGIGQTALGPEQLAGAAVQITTWKQCLVVTGKKQAYVSYVGQPLHFEPSPDVEGATFAEDDDASAGRTDYVSDDRSEDVFGIHGQDSLYAVSEFSAYALVGDLPYSASPAFRRLPGSRGVVGTRASYPLGGGIEVASQDMLAYYSVGRTFVGDDNGAMVEREETAEVRKTWTDLAVGAGCVVVEHQDEIWIFQGTKHIRNTRSRRWVAGEFPDSVKACVANRQRGLKFMDSKGRLFTISKAYTTDNGAAIPWHYETGILTSPRIHLKGMECHGSGALTVKVTNYDGANGGQTTTMTKESGRVRVGAFSVPPGFRYKVRLEGASSAITCETAILLTEKAPEGANN